LAALPPLAYEVVVLADSAERPTAGVSEVVQCWSRDSDDVSGILEQLRQRRPDLLLVEFNWGYLNAGPLAGLLGWCADAGIPVVVQLHSTEDRTVAGRTQSLRDIAAELASAKALVVHREADAAFLREIAPNTRVERTDLGQGAHADESVDDAREALGIRTQGLVFASFGFLFPHKGILESIRATDLLLASEPDAIFMASCAVVPWMPASLLYWHRCQRETSLLGLTEHVVMIRDFLPTEAAMVFLHAADVLVLPYAPTSESASAAARFALSAARPVLTTRQPIFDALGDAVFRIPDSDPVSIANGVLEVYRDASLAQALVGRAERLSASTSWEVQGQWMHKLLSSVLNGAER
jgi:glycosyltransferase involved in cell wall biosynthesis